MPKMNYDQERFKEKFMRQFLELLPVALFVGVYFLTKDIYLSTGVLMAGLCLQVGYEYGTVSYTHLTLPTKRIV